MSLVIGIVTPDTAIFGADKRAVDNQFNVVSERMQKIWRVGETVLLGAAGNNAITETTEAKFCDILRKFGEQTWNITYLAQLLQEQLDLTYGECPATYDKPKDVGFLLCGLNKRGQFELYRISGSGAAKVQKVPCCGSHKIAVDCLCPPGITQEKCGKMLATELETLSSSTNLSFVLRAKKSIQKTIQYVAGENLLVGRDVNTLAVHAPKQ